ncbi:cytochrome c [Rhizobiales bacterium]|uniref:c-type cytochrome n=1 Tax=Hongsoonwoonella zoysiae TaxID=2821844 RepID=UPI0015601CB4|nr:cytochrome c [Hongsoonwoonella zoysiae]NRG18793.1 cytochrome c [Hongsoonwoonella zoysiae]
MKNFKAYTAAGILLVAASGAFAHGGATGIVKERMDAMGELGKVMKTLSAMMRGETKYDAAVVRNSARTIRSHAGATMVKLFPEGSNPTPSEARDTIWANWNEFNELADRLALLAEGLEGAAGNGRMHEGGEAASFDTMHMMGTGPASLMGGEGMLGISEMMGGGSGFESADFSEMPADGVFNMVALTCSTCHTKFRQEKK